MRHIYRKLSIRAISVCAVFLGLTLSGTVFAQARAYRSEKKSPRAVGALVVRGKKAFLYPVSIYIDGKMLDAGLYRSTPAPMALWSDTLYDVLRDGMPAGTFTVASATKNDKGFTGLGIWKSFTSPDEKTEEAKKNEASKPKLSQSDSDPDRPVLRKPKAQAEQTPAQAPASAQPGTSGAAGREAVPPPPSVDPNAPVLRRSEGNPTLKPETKQEQAKEVAALAKSSEMPGDWYTAVSDPDPYNNRPLQYNWADDQERARMMQKVQQLAIAQLRQAAQQRRVTVPKDAALSAVSIRAYDLDYSNSPQFVLTAKYTLPTLEQRSPSTATSSPLKAAYMQLTLVARADFNGDLTKLFSAVSDPRDLDDSPSYQFIDTVDADGDGRSELLFRRQFDGTSQWVLYRVVGLTMSEFFATAQR